MSLSILYRGDLASCNYGCDYCPFAKRKDSREQLAKDKADLQRFISWVSQQPHTLSLFFTPWGEALIRGYYREAISTLSQLPNVKKVAIQTNFSCTTNWLAKCNRETVAFWVTYHPSEISLDNFLAKCRQLDQQEVVYSVGVVGMKAHLAAIVQLRERLDERVYVWVNAYKREANYYRADELALLTQIDPHFPTNNQYHPSAARACHTGHHVIAVSGNGDVTRCHFIKTVLGNIYDEHFAACLKPRLCTNERCGCHIGYIHMPELALGDVYGDRMLERVAIRRTRRL